MFLYYDAERASPTLLVVMLLFLRDIYDLNDNPFWCMSLYGVYYNTY